MTHKERALPTLVHSLLRRAWMASFSSSLAVVDKRSIKCLQMSSPSSSSSSGSYHVSECPIMARSGTTYRVAIGVGQEATPTPHGLDVLT